VFHNVNKKFTLQEYHQQEKKNTLASFFSFLFLQEKEISGMDGPTITKEFCSLKTIHCLR
jgi:hypothetical protein